MLAIVIGFILFGSFQPAPDTLSLEYCYSKIESEYPLAKKIELQDDITELNKKIVQTASYPQLSFKASATYQSEVTEFQVPTGGQALGPDLSKDHYQVSAEVSQSIFNGGRVGLKKKLEEVRGRQKKQEIQIQLHQLKEQLNKVYFGILLSRRQMEITESLSESISTQIESVTSKVENGALLPSQKYILQAELLKIKQDSIDIQHNIHSGYEILGQLIGEEVSPRQPLRIPNPKLEYRPADTLPELRPEFGVFESSRRVLDYQKELTATDKLPQLSAFGTAAYGRPGFNVFENDLHPYFMVGLRVQWNFWDAINTGESVRVYEIRQKSIAKEETAFERQLKAGLGEIREQIQSLQEKIQHDREIINLRKKAVAIVSSQMKNGAATATEYITELNKTTQARLSMMVHKTKLVRAKVDYNTLMGVSKK